MTANTLRTPEYVQQYSNRPYHYWSAVELENARVSARSTWNDKKWYLDNETAGAGPGPSCMRWEIPLYDGSVLTDPENYQALDFWRRLAWSLYAERANGVPLKPGSASSLSTGIKRFAPWMIDNGYAGPHELDSTAIARYLEHLPSEVMDDEDENYSADAFYSGLTIPDHLWTQRFVLQKVGFAPMPEPPYRGTSANAIAQGMATKACGWIKPLPDEVAILVINKAQWFLGQPSEDVLRLVKLSLEAWNGAKLLRGDRDPCDATRSERVNEVSRHFKFSKIDGAKTPWFKLIEPRQARDVINALRDACVITIMSQTGIRISEACGLRAGTDPTSKLPNSVRVERSLTGLNEIFLLRTNMSKTTPTPQFMDWVIGMRPTGSDEIPLAVRAMKILEQLYAYNREEENDYLIPKTRSAHGVPRQKSNKGIYAINLRIGMKRFVQNWIDLSELPDETPYRTEDNDLLIWKETRGFCMSTHMLRKTWAQFAIDVDPRLLPVISMQFQHLSLAMTENGYISRNPQQTELLDSVKAYRAAQLMFELARGTAHLGGRRGEEVEADILELRERMKDQPAAQAWIEAVRYCKDNDLKIFFAHHGGCMGAHTPLEMECHKLAGTQSWRNSEPNYAVRTPQICSGCSCFLVSRRNEPFWTNRYVESAVSCIQGERIGMADQFVVIKKRRDQAKKILVRIGADVAPLDAQITIRTVAQANVSI